MTPFPPETPPSFCLQLNDKFLQFAAYGTRSPETTLDGKNFSKLCKDCGLIDKKFTATDADLTFSKVARHTPPDTHMQVLEFD